MKRKREREREKKGEEGRKKNKKEDERKIEAKKKKEEKPTITKQKAPHAMRDMNNRILCFMESILRIGSSGPSVNQPAMEDPNQTIMTSTPINN